MSMSFSWRRKCTIYSLIIKGIEVVFSVLNDTQRKLAGGPVLTYTYNVATVECIIRNILKVWVVAYSGSLFL